MVKLLFLAVVVLETKMAWLMTIIIPLMKKLAIQPDLHPSMEMLLSFHGGIANCIIIS